MSTSPIKSEDWISPRQISDPRAYGPLSTLPPQDRRLPPDQATASFSPLMAPFKIRHPAIDDMKHDIIFLTLFGSVRHQVVNGQHRSVNQQHLPQAGTFPIFLKDVVGYTQLLKTLRDRFGATFNANGLVTEDVIYYQVDCIIPNAGRGEYQRVGNCYDAESWHKTLSMINDGYHARSSCFSLEDCDFCETPPVLTIWLSEEKIEKALEYNGGTQFTLIDEYDENYAMRLDKADKKQASIYRIICKAGLWEPDRQEASIAAQTPRSSPPPIVMVYDEATRSYKAQGPINSTGHDDRNIAKTMSSSKKTPPKNPNVRFSLPPNTKNGLQQSRDQTRTTTKHPKPKREARRPPYPIRKPPNFSTATVAPIGLNKKPTDCCITCLHYHTKCEGETMVYATNASS